MPGLFLYSPSYAGHTDGGMYSRADDEGMMLITDDAESFIKTDDEGAELYDNNPRVGLRY